MKQLGLLVAVAASLFVATPAMAHCDSAAPVVCCAPPPPVMVTFCVVDPCDCCTYQVSACLPAACACETPCLLTWKKGFLGRKILTYKFPCGECVEVVITKHGKASVRG